jgi:arylsulfatase
MFRPVLRLSEWSHQLLQPGGNRGIVLDNAPVSTDDDFYATDTFIDRACQFVEEALKTDDRPFFLYLAYNAPHWPFNSKWDEFLKYKGKYRDCWEALMRARLARQKAMGLVKSDIVPTASSAESVIVW